MHRSQTHQRCHCPGTVHFPDRILIRDIQFGVIAGRQTTDWAERNGNRSVSFGTAAERPSARLTVPGYQGDDSRSGYLPYAIVVHIGHENIPVRVDGERV